MLQDKRIYKIDHFMVNMTCVNASTKELHFG